MMASYNPSKRMSEAAELSLRERLMSFRVTWGDEALASSAIETLIIEAQLHGNQSNLQNLVTAVTSLGATYTGCCTVLRVKNGKNDYLGDQYPHVIFAAMWRWPAVQKDELKHNYACHYGFDLNKNMVCVNPYHYDRIRPKPKPKPMSNKELEAILSDDVLEEPPSNVTLSQTVPKDLFSLSCFQSANVAPASLSASSILGTSSVIDSNETTSGVPGPGTRCEPVQISDPLPGNDIEVYSTSLDTSSDSDISPSVPTTQRSSVDGGDSSDCFHNTSSSSSSSSDGGFEMINYDDDEVQESCTTDSVQNSISEAVDDNSVPKTQTIWTSVLTDAENALNATTGLLEGDPLPVSIHHFMDQFMSAERNSEQNASDKAACVVEQPASDSQSLANNSEEANILGNESSSQTTGRMENENEDSTKIEEKIEQFHISIPPVANSLGNGSSSQTTGRMENENEDSKKIEEKIEQFHISMPPEANILGNRSSAQTTGAMEVENKDSNKTEEEIEQFQAYMSRVQSVDDLKRKYRQLEINHEKLASAFVEVGYATTYDNQTIRTRKLQEELKKVDDILINNAEYTTLKWSLGNKIAVNGGTITIAFSPNATTSIIPNASSASPSSAPYRQENLTPVMRSSRKNTAARPGPSSTNEGESVGRLRLKRSQSDKSSCVVVMNGTSDDSHDVDRSSSASPDHESVNVVAELQQELKQLRSKVASLNAQIEIQKQDEVHKMILYTNSMREQHLDTVKKLNEEKKVLCEQLVEENTRLERIKAPLDMQTVSNLIDEKDKEIEALNDNLLSLCAILTSYEKEIAALKKEKRKLKRNSDDDESEEEISSKRRADDEEKTEQNEDPLTPQHVFDYLCSELEKSKIEKPESSCKEEATSKEDVPENTDHIKENEQPPSALDMPQIDTLATSFQSCQISEREQAITAKLNEIVAELEEMKITHNKTKSDLESRLKNGAKQYAKLFVKYDKLMKSSPSHS